MRSISLLVILCFATACLAQYRSPAEIFDGSYHFVYTTQQRTPGGPRVITNTDRIGNIGYWPAYKGALYGNMSVVFGVPDLPDTIPCLDALSKHTAYTGPYTVNPIGDGDGRGPYVAHFPLINSNPITTHTVPGAIAKRYYEMSNFDVDLTLYNYDANNGTLLWRRNFPYPRPADKAVSVSLVLRSGSQWVANGVTSGVYDLVFTNTGAVALSAATVEFSFASGVSISSSWGLSRLGTSDSYVAQLHGLQPGQSYSGNGAIISGPAGFNTPSVGVNPASVA